MMDKERLEEIKRKYRYLDDSKQFVIIPKGNFNRLIEQAERVQELGTACKSWQKRHDALEAENKRYHDVIEKLYKFDGDVQQHSALADMLCGEVLEEST